ncbi:hypothetical protein METBIDRAFT_39289 [Metschnikowia bicuspidata var. bicuspidata NRRL YB-4993]|uniref:Mediator of RNA polymerase II transcription subunit 9 n=1 Tax=Metschnikowia bicuspidata var. bicuspidata NRRL YB-4993 TaxID=869754 RepID=A0A1A0HDB2_9ASCO|nr:hypothetical protein METBIDRAFT_39289 [Metschnikowia bicuspidata var. bicuspidata NRRL YB-4993]OBA22069.1 hypothetical protein METBIDRAFT_39289 [Metschnikowia bicuspidata var. bicuspidata NRRL YB-4993]
MEKAPQSPSPVADTSTAPNGNAQKRDDAAVLEKLAQIELLPDLFALLQRVATGDIKGQDFDNHAGPIRLKLNTIRLHLQEIDGICETVDQRQKKIEVLKDCNARRASFLRDFKSRVLADLREE